MRSGNLGERAQVPKLGAHAAQLSGPDRRRQEGKTRTLPSLYAHQFRHQSQTLTHDCGGGQEAWARLSRPADWGYLGGHCAEGQQTPLLAEKKRSPTPSPEVVGYQHLPTFGMGSKISSHRSEALSWDRELEALDRVPAAQLRHSTYDSHRWRLLSPRGLGHPCQTTDKVLFRLAEHS